MDSTCLHLSATQDCKGVVEYLAKEHGKELLHLRNKAGVTALTASCCQRKSENSTLLFKTNGFISVLSLRYSEVLLAVFCIHALPGQKLTHHHVSCHASSAVIAHWQVRYFMWCMHLCVWYNSLTSYCPAYITVPSLMKSYIIPAWCYRFIYDNHSSSWTVQEQPSPCLSTSLRVPASYPWAFAQWDMH